MKQSQLTSEMRQLWHQLSEGDRLRLVQFARAILESRQGKRQKRQQRFLLKENNDAII